MATSKGTGPGAAYQRGGLAEVWRWAKAHGLKGWLRAKHWAARRAEHALPANKRRFQKAEAAYQKKLHHARALEKKQRRYAHGPYPSGDKRNANFVSFDGLWVPRWIVRDALAPARASGVWKGKVFSGFRTPAYSTSLCEHMCGAPACPGRCAGASSNHSCPPTHSGVPHEGAVDVTDYAGLRAWCATHGYPLRGGGMVLPSDLPHFSREGN